MPKYKLADGRSFQFADDGSEQFKINTLLVDFPDAEEIEVEVEDPKKEKPTTPDAVVEETKASKNTDLSLEDGSLELPSNDLYEKSITDDLGNYGNSKKNAREAYSTLQDKLLNIPQEQVDEQFINDYFKLDQRPVVTTSKSTGILPGQVEYENNPIPIKEYLSPEKFAQYEQALAGEPIIGADSNEQAEITETKTQARENVREKTQEQYLNSLPTKVKETIQNDKEFKYNITGAQTFIEDKKLQNKQLELQLNKNVEKYNSEIEGYNTQFDDIQGQLDILIENSNGGVLTVDKAGNPNATPATVIEYNKLIGEAKELQDQYKNSELDLFYNGIIAEGEVINFNVKQINNKVQEIKDQSLLEASLKKDYTFGAAAGMAMEEFFAGSAVNFASLSAQLGLQGLKPKALNVAGKLLNVATPGVASGLEVLGVDFNLNKLNQEKVDDAISYVKKQTFDYNTYLRKKRETNIPDAPTLDDIKGKDVTFSNWFTRAFADNSPSMLVSFIPGGTGLATTARTRKAISLSNKLSKKLANNKKREALRSQKNFMQASMRTVQGTFFIAETGSKFKEIEESPESKSYTFSQKAFNSISSGLTAMYAETLGQTQMLAQGRKFIKDYGTRKFKKEAYNNIGGFTKNLGVKLGLNTSGVILKGAAINTAEESLTLFGQNALDIIVLGEDKSILEGANKDFFAQQLIASFGLSAPQALGGTMNILKNEFRTGDEVIKIQGYVKDFVKVDEQLNNYKGDKRSSEYRGFKNQKNEIITKLAIADAEVLQKLNSLSIDQIEKVADLKRQMRLINSEAEALGQSGLTGKDVNEARARLETQYRALDKQYNSILNTKNKNMVNFEAVIAEELGNDFVNTNAAYYFGLLNFQKDAALTMLSKNGSMLEVNDDTKTTDESLKDYTLEDRLKILQGRQDGNNATFIFNPKTKAYDIVLYENNTRRAIGVTNSIADAKFAAGGPLHELSHIRNIEKSIVNKNGELSEEGKKAVDEMIIVLKENKALGRLNITEADYNAIIRRFEGVKSSKAGQEEVMIALSDAALLGMIDINDIKNYMPKSNNFVKNLINELLGENGYLAQINTAEDVFNYVKKYQKDIIAKKVVMDTEPEEEQTSNDKKFSKATLFEERKELFEEIKSYIPSNIKTDGEFYNFIRDPKRNKALYDSLLEETGAINRYVKTIRTSPEQGAIILERITDRMLGFKPEAIRENGQIVGIDAFAERIMSDSRYSKMDANLKLFKKSEIDNVTEDLDNPDVNTQLADDVNIDSKIDNTPKQQTSKLRRDLGIKQGDDLYNAVKQTAKEIFGKDLDNVELKKLKAIVNKKARGSDIFKDVAKLMGTEKAIDPQFLNKNILNILKDLPVSDLVKLERGTKDQKIFTKTGPRLGPIAAREAVNDGLLPKNTNINSGPRVSEKLPVTLEQAKEFFNQKRKAGLVGVIAENLISDAAPSVTKEIKTPTKRRAEVLDVIDRDPELKFSAGLRKIFNLPLKGRSKVDALLTSKGLNKTLNLKKDILTEPGRKKILDNFKYIMTFGPKEMWFGPRGGSVFTTSGKDYDISMSEFRNDGSKNPKWTKEKSDALKQLRQDLIDYSKSDKAVFGKPIKGVTDYKLSSYSTLLGNSKNAAVKNKNGDIESFNDKVSKIHKEMWKRFNTAIKNDEKNASKIATYLKLVANHTGHWHKLGAQIVGWSTNPKGKNGTLYEYEHAMPATAAYLYLLDTAIDKGNFDLSYQAVMDNYKLIALDKAENAKLGKAGLSTGMPQGWFLGDNFWWQRYFNPEVGVIEGGIPPNSIMMTNGRTMGDQLGVDAMGERTTETIEASKKLAAKFNDKILPPVDKLKGNFTNQQVLDKMAEVDNESVNEELKFSQAIDMSGVMNDIIQAKTGIASEKTYSRVKAEVVGANKGRFDFFIPPSAEDFVGLLYKTLGKGKLGDDQMAWYKAHLLNPFARAMDNITRDTAALMNDFKVLKEDLKVVPKTLKKIIPGGKFTQEQAVRTYIWTKQGMNIPGISEVDKKELNNFVENNPNLVVFADQLIAMQKGDQYAGPGDGWIAGNITTDLMEGVNTIKRSKYLEVWQSNVDQIFSEANLNKLEAAYGKNYRLALENSLQRMKTGKNRSFGGDTLTGRVTDWLTNSIGAIMFFNTRSAVLQTISAVNFINFGDNNIYAAGKAFANQKQYWKDFKMLFNSDFLVQRRNGLKLNVNEADIADMAKKDGVRGVISELLRLGFLPTQLADSFAIASGGSTFYRNRLKALEKQGMSKAEAEAQAFQDFRETAEESQQSSRPDRISQQQAGPLGRVILAFANTPAQYARIIKKAASDLKNRRGDDKTNVSKILYYGFAQNLIFNALQQALFGLAFGDEEEELTEKEKNKKEKRYVNVANGMADSLLRGAGLGGAVFSVLKNVALRLNQESDKKSPKYQDVLVKEILQISPPISSKVGKLRAAGRSYSWNRKEMMTKGWSIDNPAYLAAGQVIAATTNIPLDRALKKIDNIRNASNSDLEAWQRIASAAGWSAWELDIKKPSTSSSRKLKIRTLKRRKIKKRTLK